MSRMVDIEDLHLAVSGSDKKIYLTALKDEETMDMDYRREITNEAVLALANWMIENETIVINVGEGQSYIFNIEDPIMVQGIQTLADEGITEVPEIVSQWYQSNKDDIENAIRKIVVRLPELQQSEPWELNDLQRFFLKEDAITIVTKMKYGYIVSDMDTE